MAGRSVLTRIVDIRPQERAMAGSIVASFALIQSSHAFGANAADALFFLRFGVDQLPQWIMVSGVVVMGVVIGHAASLGAVGPRRWLPLATLITSGWAAAGWVGIAADVPGIYAIVWVSTQAIMIVTLTIMWNTAGAACTTRQAKRLFPLFASAGVAGAVVGNLLTGPLAALLGTENLLLVQAGALLGGSFLVARARRFFMTEDSSPRSSMVAELKDTATSVVRSKFLALAALVAIAMNALFFLVYFPFSESVAASFATEAEVAAFLGVFASIATASTFLVSLVVTNRLFSRLGLVLTLLIVPAVYAAGFALWFGVFTLTTAVIVRGVHWVAFNAIGATAYPALFNVATGRRRSEIVAFMTAVPAQIGVVAGGLLLILVAGLPDRVTYGFGFAAAVGFGAVVLRMRPAYLDAVISAVKQGVVGVFDAPARGVVTPSDADTRQVLISHLADPRAPARAVAVTALARLADTVDPTVVEPLMDDSDPLVRGAAFETMCAIDPRRVASHAEVAINDEAPDVRLHVLHHLADHTGEEIRSVARPSLRDSDPRVRAAAAVVVGGEEGAEALRALAGGKDPRGVVAALTEIGSLGGPQLVDPAPLLEHDDAGVREAAVRLAAHHGSSADVLCPLVDDRSPRVRAAAADSLARTDEGTEKLIGILATGSVVETEAALEALTPIAEMTPEFISWARGEAERAAFLLACEDALDPTVDTDEGAYLRRVLRLRIDRLLGWVLRATTTSDTISVMAVVERGVHSRSPETRAQAIEALEAIGESEVTSVLIPLLEPEHGPGSMSESEALEKLEDDFDPWLSRLARAASRVTSSEHRRGVASYASMPASDHPPSLSTFEKVLVLQKAPMFAELDPEDLEMLAQATTERHYEASGLIYRQGEIGDEMMIVVGGSVVVSVAEGTNNRVIETYGPGEPVGELSLLAAGARSASVTAGDEGAHGLTLTKSELMSVLEDRPSVTFGLLATLARRVAHQTTSH